MTKAHNISFKLNKLIIKFIKLCAHTYSLVFIYEIIAYNAINLNRQKK